MVAMRLRLIIYVIGLLASYIAMHIYYISEVIDHDIISYVENPYKKSSPSADKTG